MKSLIVLGLFLGLMSMASSSLGGVSNCGETLAPLKPCMPYLAGITPSLSPSCCVGVSTVKAKGDTTEARRTICQCVKDTAPMLGVKPDRAKLIPQLCKIELPVPIDPNVDCSKIQ